MPKKGGSWLFLGPEIGEKQAAIDELTQVFRSGGARGAPVPPEETVYYAGEMPVSRIVSAMQNGSLFADTRLFFIKSAEGIRKKEDIDLLSSYIAAPPDDTFLVLISDETSVARGLEAAVPSANKRIFWELSDSRKSDWVYTFFRQEGYTIGAEGVATILELVENNTAALRQECSRLIFFLDKNREITGEEAEKWLSHTREESAFTLFSRIAAGDFSRSLECVRMLLAAKEAPPAIFAALASCFRKLAAYLALKGAGVSDQIEYRKIGVSSPGAKRDYAAAGRRYDAAGAELCLSLTAECDLRARSALSFPVQILMDQYVYRIFSLAVPAGEERLSSGEDRLPPGRTPPGRPRMAAPAAGAALRR